MKLWKLGKSLAKNEKLMAGKKPAGIELFRNGSIGEAYKKLGEMRLLYCSGRSRNAASKRIDSPAKERSSKWKMQVQGLSYTSIISYRLYIEGTRDINYIGHLDWSEGGKSSVGLKVKMKRMNGEASLIAKCQRVSMLSR